MKATIEGVRGVYKGRKVDLPKARLDIGRDTNNSMVFQADTTLSRKHASIFFQDGTWFCVDLGSTNGTYLNGVQVGSTPVQIPDQSIISCGQQEFRIAYEKSLMERFNIVGPRVTPPPIITPPPLQPPIRPPLSNAGSTAKSQKANNASEEWFGQGSTLMIHGLIIQSPLVYVLSKNQNEPSLVRPELRAGPSANVDELPYWPTYGDMNPAQRWVYLKWLESGRRSKVDVGYAFVFFYGLERRLTGPGSHQISKDERTALLNELRELCLLYPDSYSFQSYSHKLDQSQWQMLPEQVHFDPLSDGHRMWGEETFILGISCLSHNKQPFTIEHAMQWFEGEITNSTKVAALRCKDESALLFQRRIEKFVGNGIILGPGKSNIPNIYVPANLSLRNSGGRTDRSIPRALEAQKVLNQLRTFTLSCLEDLTPCAKMIGSETTAIAQKRASFLLPIEIRHLSQPANALSSTLSRMTDVTPHLELKQIQREIGIGEEPLKKLETQFFDLCAELGFIVEPDPRFGVIPGSQIESLAITKAVESTSIGTTAKVSAALRTALLGAHVLRSPSVEAQIPKAIIVDSVSDSFSLIQVERQRISAFVDWLQEIAPKVTKATFVAMDEGFRDMAKRSLLAIIRQSAQVTGPTIKNLTAILMTWGWAENDVYSQLHEEGPVLIATEKEGKQFKIPQQPASESVDGPMVDMSKVRAQQEETKVVSQLLGEVFSDQEEPLTATKNEVSEGQTSVIQEIIKVLRPGVMTKAVWQFIAEERQTAASALLELINDYAIDNCDAPLIIGDDPFEVEEDILLELRNE